MIASVKGSMRVMVVPAPFFVSMSIDPFRFSMDFFTTSSPTPLPETLATGYQQTNGEQVPQPLDYDGDYPAGSIFTTAEDMTHFILAHLQDGCYMDGCILGADSLEAMHQKQAETPYEGQAVTFGFTEGTFDKARMIGHSGATGGFGSILDMLPDHGMGYFFSFNEECHETDACQIISEFRTAFLEQFLE